MSKDVPYFVKFRTPYGVVTTLARPELRTIDVYDDTVDYYNSFGNRITSFARSRNCDLNVVFHSQANPESEDLYRLEVLT